MLLRLVVSGTVAGVDAKVEPARSEDECSWFANAAGARGLKYKRGLMRSYEHGLDKEGNFRTP